MNENTLKDESREIGELISEITRKGYFGIEVDLDENGECDVEVWNNHDRDQALHVGAHSMTEALSLVVDSIRASRGEPSLAQELATLIKKNEAHANVRFVTGPDAGCTCGSIQPLEFIVKAKVRMSWKTGRDLGHFVPNVEPGDVGTCPHCGLCYTFLDEHQTRTD